MHANEVNETGRRGRRGPEPPGSASFSGATRAMEGWEVNSERTDQLVLGDVGCDNDWGRKFQTIRDLALFSFNALSTFEKAPFLTRFARASQFIGIFTSVGSDPSPLLRWLLWTRSSSTAARVAIPH